MTATEMQTETGARMDSLFGLIRVALVGLSAVVLGSTLWYTFDLAALAESVSPFALGTVVFTLAVALAAKKSTAVVDRELSQRRSHDN